MIIITMLALKIEELVEKLHSFYSIIHLNSVNGMLDQISHSLLCMYYNMFRANQFKINSIQSL